MNNELNFKRNRNNRLLDATIVLKIKDMDVDNNKEEHLYDEAFKLFEENKLDKYYDSIVFRNHDENFRNNLLNRAKKYKRLCFKDKDASLWKESLVDDDIDNLEDIFYTIMDQYEFILDLCKNNAYKSLDALCKLFNNKNLDSSVISYITFNKDINKVRDILLTNNPEEIVNKLFDDDKLNNISNNTINEKEEIEVLEL